MVPVTRMGLGILGSKRVGYARGMAESETENILMYMTEVAARWVQDRVVDMIYILAAVLVIWTALTHVNHHFDYTQTAKWKNSSKTGRRKLSTHETRTWTWRDNNTVRCSESKSMSPAAALVTTVREVGIAQREPRGGMGYPQ